MACIMVREYRSDRLRSLRPGDGGHRCHGSRIEGLGGHAARPRGCLNSVLVGAQLITALQSIVSRTIDPLNSVVVSMCEFHAGNARNVIPQTAELRGTVGTLTAEARELVEKRVREVVAGVAQMTGAKIDLVYKPGYPVTVNHALQTDVAADAGEGDCRRRQCSSDAADDGCRRISPTCWRPGPARFYSAAMATAPDCVVRPTISTMRRSCSVPHTGSNWSKTRWRRERHRGLITGGDTLAHSRGAGLSFVVPGRAPARARNP